MLGGRQLLGAEDATLTLTNVQPAQAGRYFVLVSNDYGSIESQAVVLTYTDAAILVLNIHPSLAIYGTVGRSYRILLVP